MNQMRNEVKIGMAIVIAVLVGVVGFRFMRDVPVFRVGTVLYATYPRVDGLTTGSPITVSGIKVGSVRTMEILDNDSVRVSFNISGIDGIPKGSIAYIRASDLLGTKVVEIERSDAAEFAAAYESLPGVFDEGIMGELGELGGRVGGNVETSTERLASVLRQVDGILQDGGSQDIAGTLDHLNATTAEVRGLLEARRMQLRNTIAHVERITARLDTLTAQESQTIRNTLGNLEAASGEIDQLMAGLNETTTQLNILLTRINNGEGTLGLLATDPNLYRNLDSLTYNLNETVKTLNANPKHYLRHLRLIRVF